jgi:hypothetical protein
MSSDVQSHPADAPLPLETVARRILLLRGQKVLLDADLAALYGVTTKRFNEQIKRNLERFPADFMFRLDAAEFENLRSQFATSNTEPSPQRGGRRYLPLAFTEHGAIMAATVLNTPRATEVAVYVVRAFVQLREALHSHRELAGKLAELERKTEAMAMRHAGFERDTKLQMRQVFEAIRELMAPEPEPEPPKRPIGFVIPEQKRKKKT